MRCFPFFKCSFSFQLCQFLCYIFKFCYYYFCRFRNTGSLFIFIEQNRFFTFFRNTIFMIYRSSGGLSSCNTKSTNLSLSTPNRHVCSFSFILYAFLSLFYSLYNISNSLTYFPRHCRIIHGI